MKELPLEELIGSLITYEMKIARQEKEMQEESKKKSIALKAREVKVVEEAKFNNMEEDIADISKKIQKLIMKDKFGGRTYNKKKATTRRKVLQKKKKRKEELNK